MKILCSVGPFYGSTLSLKDFAEKAVSYGYNGIEIGLDGIIWPKGIKDEEIKAVKKMKLSVGVHLPFNYVIVDNDGEYGVFQEGTDEYFINSIKKSVKFAKKINADYCVYHPTMQILTNTKPTDELYLNSLAVAKTLVAEVYALCLEKKIKLCIENVIPYFKSPIEVMNEFTGLTENINVCFDVGINMLDSEQLDKKEDWGTWFKKYGDTIHVVHFSDVIHVKKMATHHMKLGTSRMDFEKFFKETKKVGAEYLVSEEAFSEFTLEKQKAITWQERKETLEKIRKWLE